MYTNLYLHELLVFMNYVYLIHENNFTFRRTIEEQNIKNKFAKSISEYLRLRKTAHRKVTIGRVRYTLF